MKTALQNGFSQVVILGAGNDTSLHRIAPLSRYLFEIDAERTQQFKMHNLSEKLLNEEVVFVSVNFEEESWLDKRRTVGGDDVTHRKTLFIWASTTSPSKLFGRRYHILQHSQPAAESPSM